MTEPYPVDHSMNFTIPGTGQNMTMHVYYPDVPTSVVVMLVYVVATMAIAMVMFRRKELLG
jgi:ABC-type transport system involved in multi-copper enzyme maturation permease subunit